MDWMNSKRLSSILENSVNPSSLSTLLVTHPFPLLSLAEEHHLHGLQHDHRVELKRVMSNVIKIVLQFFDRILIALAVGIIHLRPASDPRFHQVPEMIEWDLLFIAFRAFCPLRARSDQTHLPTEHIPKLR